MSSTLKRLARRVLGEKFQGFFDTGKTQKKKRTVYYPGEHGWSRRCKHYDDVCEQYGLAKQAMFTVAGQLLGRAKEGVFLEAAKNPSTKKPYDRSVEAMQKCMDLNDKIGMPLMLYELGHSLPKYGSHFWEQTFDPVFDVRAIPMQENIEPREANDIGEVVVWRQYSNSLVKVSEWTNQEIIHFSWDVTSRSWPYGTSLLAGLETEFEVMEQLEINSKDYMEKQAWPYEMGRVGDAEYRPTEDELSTIKSKWKNRAIGENILTSYPIEMIQGGTGGNPIRELGVLLDFLKDNVIDSTLVPPISKQYNATQASAKEMMPWALANLIWPLQRMIKWKVQNEVYKPYLESLGYSVKTCPKLLFEPPDIISTEKADFLSKGVLAGYIPPRWAALQSGVPEEEFDKWLKEEAQREEEEFNRQQKQFEKQNAVAQNQQGQKSLTTAKKTSGFSKQKA